MCCRNIVPAYGIQEIENSRYTCHIAAFSVFSLLAMDDKIYGSSTLQKNQKSLRSYFSKKDETKKPTPHSFSATDTQKSK